MAPDELNGASALCVSAPFVLSNHPHGARTLVFVLAPDFVRRLYDDPAGVEIDARRDTLGERKKQGFAALSRARSRGRRRRRSS